MRQDATVEVGAGARARQRGLMGWWLGGGVEEGGTGPDGQSLFSRLRVCGLLQPAGEGGREMGRRIGRRQLSDDDELV